MIGSVRRVSGRISQAMAAVAVMAALAPAASATPVGVLSIDSGGAGITFGLASIDFLPAAGGDGDFTVGFGTTLTTASGNPSPGDPGVIQDVVLAGLPVVNFLTFLANPALAFDLNTLGPGSANTVCAGLAVGDSCSPVAGSPYGLTNLGAGTLVSFAGAGVARDATTPSDWTGVFTTQIAGTSPAAIQALFLGNPQATLTSTWSAELSVTAIPEPAALGFGAWFLLAVGRRARRRR
jgi:hypothetical protein